LAIRSWTNSRPLSGILYTGFKCIKQTFADFVAEWRYSVQDAFYQPPGVPLVPGSANAKRFLGAQSNLQAEWQASAHLSVNAAHVHFLTEGFLKAAGAKDIDFLGVWGSYKF
jgi:hypothetical protein